MEAKKLYFAYDSSGRSHDSRKRQYTTNVKYKLYIYIILITRLLYCALKRKQINETTTNCKKEVAGQEKIRHTLRTNRH